MYGLLNLEIRYEQDIVLARQRARQIAQLLGFEAQDQTRIATAVSEIARNAFQYAQGGRVEFSVETAESVPYLLMTICDRGPGIPHLAQVLSGQYTSSTGLGLGLVGARQLMDRFEVESTPSGTEVKIAKNLPLLAPSLTPPQLSAIADRLIQRSPQSPFQEIQQQNQELLQALEALRRREEQLSQLNQELEDTNRGVVALYAELDEKADSLRRANELKTRFLSNMSHEFRTPLNSILSLSRLLLDRLDGDLNAEQEKQVVFIRKAAEGLSELVNDLLDLAKVEAGKLVLRPSSFEIGDLFATLRGMLRPLLAHNTSINLIFEEPQDFPELYTDEGKVAQILRNFISNALKYTEQGEVRIWATACQGDRIMLSVADTGIGISPTDRERIFEDFVQIESHLQKRVKGTGLGLPLSQKLAELLGGTVSVASTIGVGSTFSVTLPRIAPGAEQTPQSLGVWELEADKYPVLIIEDHPDTLFAYEKSLEQSIYQPIAAQTLSGARDVLAQLRPVAIILDILLEGQSSWAFLSELKEHPETQDIPILVITVVNNETLAIARGADGFLIKPIDRLLLLNQLNRLVKQHPHQNLLVIDDDPAARYLLKQYLSAISFNPLEAEDGIQGIQLAQTEQPRAIILDLVLPDVSGIEVFHQLKSNPVTSHIPIIINTSQPQAAENHPVLVQQAVAILSKAEPSTEEAIAKLYQALLKAGLSWESGGTSHG